MHFLKDWNRVTEETERILYYFEYLCALKVVLYSKPRPATHYWVLPGEFRALSENHYLFTLGHLIVK